MGRPVLAVNAGPCGSEGCDRKPSSRGLCAKHYRHLWYQERGRAARGHLPVVLTQIGDTRMNSSGYVEKKVGSGRRSWVLQHRLVMERHLGRPLTSSETVHHVNGNRTDNRTSNLELWASRQPKGQRVADLLAYAQEIIDTYGDRAWQT